MNTISSRALRYQRRHRKNREKIGGHNENNRLNMVFFTGAGLSAESGISTFRGKGELWYKNNNIRYFQVSSLETDLAECLVFHNRRRRTMLKAFPSQAHYLMAELQQRYHVRIITQNIDDLHERAGSNSIIHLHGSIQFLVPKGFRHPKYRLPWCNDINVGDRCPRTGSQLRPDVVLFGETIYGYRQTRRWLCEADIVVIVGTSLLVEPAHSLLGNINPVAKIYYINPESQLSFDFSFPDEQIIDGANSGMSRLLDKISSCWKLD